MSGASASPSGPTTATVRATANANLQDTTVLVRYGTTTAYGPTAVTQDAGAGNAPVPVSVPLSGLTPATTYHAVLIATNADGKTSSSDLLFTTSTAKGVGPSGGRGGGRPTSPSLRRVRQSAGRWLEGNARATITARRGRLPVGTTFSFSLNEPAMVSFAFTQSLDGRRIGRRCVAPGSRNLREPRCTRTVIRGTLSLTGRPGTNRVRFTGRLSGNRRLEPGQYTLLVMATNTARQRSVTRRLTFTIVRRRR